MTTGWREKAFDTGYDDTTEGKWEKLTSCYDMGNRRETNDHSWLYTANSLAWSGKRKEIRAAIATVGALRGVGTASSRILP